MQDFSIGGKHCLLQLRLTDSSLSLQLLTHDFHKQLAGDLAGRLSAHAVSHNVHTGLENRRTVFIDRAHRSLVCCQIGKHSIHLSNLSSTIPMRTKSPERR